MKIVVVSALAIGVFNAALVGANHLAFAAATNGTQVIPVTTEVVDIPLAVAPAGFQTPNLTVIGSPALGGHPNNTVSATAMQMEEAAQLGAQYIWDVFGESIDGMYVEMLFAAWPSQSRTYWMGSVHGAAPIVIDENSTVEARTARVNSELFRFTIDAVTGLRVDISPGFSYVPQPSQVRSPEPLSDEQVTWLVAWEAMTTGARMAYLGLTQADIEPYLQAAREFARSHFNNSAVVYETESFDVVHRVDRLEPSGFGGIVFRVSDDTGREAEIWLNAGTRDLRSGLGITTRDNDFIPGFVFVGDGSGIG